MAALRRFALVLGVVSLLFVAWVTQEHAQSAPSRFLRGPAPRLSGGRPDSALVWGPNQYDGVGSTTWNYSATTLTISSFDASKRYFVRITNGDTTSGANRASQVSMTINGKEFLGSSDITSTVSALNKVIWITNAQSTLQFGVLGPAGSFIRARIYETSDPSYDIHMTQGEITVPNGLNLISDAFTKPANASGPWTVRVVNGDGDGANACTNLKVTLNGVDVVPLGLVNTTNLTVVRQVTLQTNNTVTLRLYGTSGYATLYWTATDTTPPSVNLVRPANGYVTDSASVAVSATLSDQTPPLSVSVDGVPGTFNASSGFTVAKPLPTDGLYTFAVKATDRAGYQTAIVQHVIRDTQAPDLFVGSPPALPATTTSDSILVSGAWSDTSITTATVDDVVVGLPDSSGTFSMMVPLDPGSNGVLFRAVDALGHSTQFKRYVNRAAAEPVISGNVQASPITETETTPFRDDVKFLFTGTGALQGGASLVPDSIKADRVAVLRGLVFSRDLGPLPNVLVRVLSHPEFGEVKTREDGRFDLAVNGGQPLTLRFTKAGYLESQRQVNPPPLQYAQTDSVALIGESSRFLPVNTATDTMLVGRFESDANGDRRLWIYVPSGASATITPDGGPSLPPLNSYRMRLKEFTVGSNGDESMPGQLPPTTAYTYCVDMSLREADSLRDLQGAETMRPRVSFAKRLSTYVKDFLGMPVGTVVPSGSYDPRAGAWVPNEDGRVVRVLSVASGIAALDTDGDGSEDSPARYDSLGLDTLERARLAKTFHANDVLWRMRIDHFSAPDFNFNWGANSTAGTLAAGTATPGDGLVGDLCPTPGCVIENENRVLGETIPIVGTPYSLHYRSSRQVDDQTLRWIRIPLTGDPVPAGLRAIHVVVDVAGRRFTQDFFTSPFQPFEANKVYLFKGWDGKDGYGRKVLWSTTATVRVGYETPLAYAISATGSGQFGNSAATSAAPTRATSGDRDLGRIDWRTQTVSLGAPSLEAASLGHWTISPHHVYDPTGPGTLYLGDGRTRYGRARFPVIKMFAGTGDPSGAGEPLSTPSKIHISPDDVACSPDGSVYFADKTAGRIGRITKDGRIENVVGGGPTQLPFDGAVATTVSPGGVNGIAFEPTGDLLFAVSGQWRVFRVTRDGIIHLVAGNGSQTSPPFVEGAQANSQHLGEPLAVAVGPDASIFIADHGANKIYRVNTDGSIRTFAGNGTRNFGPIPPNGSPATTVAIDPCGIAVDPQGVVYFSDSYGPTGRLLQITPDGIMRQLSPAPDHNPKDLAIGPDGALYVGQTQTYSGVVRREADGQFTTIAGAIQNNTDQAPRFPDEEGGVAAGTRMANLHGIAVGANGDIFTAEAGIVGGNGGTFPAGIRRIAPEAPWVQGTDSFYPSEDGNEAYVFNASGRHLRTVDTRSGVAIYTFGYGADGRLTSIEDSNHHLTTIERSGGVATAIVSPFGQQRTELSMTGAGYLETVRNPAGDIVSLGYTGAGGSLLSYHRSPEGEADSLEYDEDGRLSRDSNPAGGADLLSVVPNSESDVSRTVQHTSPLGRVTLYQVQERLNRMRSRLIRGPDLSYTYRADSLNSSPPSGGEVVREVGAAGEVTVTVPVRDPRYGMLAPIPSVVTTTLPSGLSATVTTGRGREAGGITHDTLTIAGHAFRSDYDSTQRRLTITSPTFRTTMVDFDDLGRPVTLSSGGLAPVGLVYDPLTKFVSDVSQGGRTWHYDYDDSGRVRVARDPLLRNVVYGYDAAGRVLSQDLPGGRSVAYRYDRNGSLIALTPPGRPAHRFHYTPVGLNDRYVPPPVPGAEDSTQYTYNFDRQLTQVTRPGGAQVQFGYDPSTGQLLTVTEPRGMHTFTYWDTPQPGTSAPSGQLKTVSSPDSIVCAYSYDGPLLTQETWSGRVSGSVSRTYDNAFRLRSEQVNGAQGVTYDYDADGLLSAVNGAGWSLAVTRQAATGLLEGTSAGSGPGAVTSRLTYDSHGELWKLEWTKAGAPYFAQTLTRDSLGRITQVDETLEGVSTSRTYGYHPAGWLASVGTGASATSRAYEYDGNAPGGNGNRTAERDGAGTLLASATYDAQDRLLGYGDASYAYTAAGELRQRSSSADTLTTEYDALGNLVGAGLKPASNSGSTSGLAIGTVIDYQVDGENRRVRKRVNGEPVAGWLYRDGVSVVAELDGTGAVLNRYVYGTLDHAPDLIERADGTYRVITDQLGSVRAVVNLATGEVAQRLDYDAWGNLTLDPAPGFQGLGYAGGLEDRDTKLIRFGARDYEPGTGRWTSKDPRTISHSTISSYQYCDSEPLSLVDVSGMSPVARGYNLPALPPGEDIDKNICEALRHKGDWLWLALKVRSGGDWDYKTKGRQYEAGGNTNFGAVASAVGVPNDIQRRAAGLIQQLAGTSRNSYRWPRGLDEPIPFLEFPYGDQPIDQVMIILGEIYFKDARDDLHCDCDSTGK